MKHLTTILCLVSTLAVSAGCRQPVESGKSGSPADNTTANSNTEIGSYGDPYLNVLQSEFDLLVASTELTDEQKLELESWYNNSIKQLSSWFDENGPTIKKIQGKAISAGKRKDLASIERMNRGGDKETVTRLVNEQRDMLNEHRNELETKIPAAQRMIWRSKLIAQKLLKFLEPLSLSDQQVRKIDELAPDAIKKLKTKQLENWRGYGTSNLEKLFESQVINEQQKAPFEELKNSNRMRMLRWGDRF